MADIWLASLTGPGGFSSQVVIKTILQHLANRPEFVQMFLSEARLAAQLHHPNIAQIFELGEEDGTHYLAMEYIPGVDVRRLYRDADGHHLPVPMPLAIRIVIEVATALGYAHSAIDEHGEPLRIVHRDVSPENILVTYQGGVKLVDFGIAKAIDEISDTRTGVLKGKYSYMSPERVEGQPFDGRADLFSLGVVAFEILTGLRLFRRESDLATIQAVAECEVPLPSSVAPDLPPALDGILMRALARDADDRFPDGATFAMSLEQFLQEGRFDASASHLAAYLRDLYPNPGPPPALGDADTESTTGARPRVDQVRSLPPQARSAQPRSLPPLVRPSPLSQPTLAPRSSPASSVPLTGTTGPRRISQLAPRGPIQDPRVTKEQTDEAEALNPPSSNPRRPSMADLAAADEGDDPSRVRRPLQVRRWALLGLKLAAVGGMIALGAVAFPSLKHALGQLSAEANAHGDDGPPGHVSITSTPAATVYLGDNKLGRTPLDEAEVPVGKQQLHLVNDVEALDETIEVVVPPDETLLLHPTFPEGSLDLNIPPGHRYKVLYKNVLLGRIPGPAIQLCAGPHDLVLVDERTGQREARHVTVVAHDAKHEH